MNIERLPPVVHRPPGQAYSSATSSPQISSIASSNASHSGSQSSFSSVSVSHGQKTPPPNLSVDVISDPQTTIASFDVMNPGTEMYYHQHMSAGQPPQPQTVTSGAMSHYPQHQQPALLQPGPGQYSTQGPYSQYGYSNGMASSPSAPPSVSNPMGSAQNVLPLPGVGTQGAIPTQYQGFDTTGQQPPPGMKPRVTATLWEDEGSLCFQVEARGICVARREDNHMINGTKLLNVAGMTRGRRDGILKSEKVRHVVKIGPMHLKGVWIPYDRALDFANKEKITELLYPLFVHNIGALLYHPTNQTRTTQVMAAAERRKNDPQGQLRGQGLPSINHHAAMGMPGPQAHLPSQGGMVRPSLDRAHTFPTPPTSANGVIGSMGASDNFNWQGQSMNTPQGANPMTIDTGLGNARSMPNTPATTPPGSMQTMQPYPSGAQAYDTARPMYNAPPAQQSPYQTASTHPPERLYAPHNSYAKNEMAPPSSRPAASGPSGDPHDSKPPNGLMHGDHPSHPHAGDDEGDHEHEAEYTHDSVAYDAQRPSYPYTAPGVGALANEANLSPEMTGSPNHGPGSGRATPRTAPPPQPYYSQHPGYQSSPRVQQTSSSLYNVISHDRTSANGTSGNDGYAQAPDMSTSMPNGYAPQPPIMNGNPGTLKRGRDDGDDLSRPPSAGPSMPMELKRRKTLVDGSAPAPAYDSLNRPVSAITAPNRR